MARLQSALQGQNRAGLIQFASPLLLASEQVKRSGMMIRLNNTGCRASIYRDEALETLERSE